MGVAVVLGVAAVPLPAAASTLDCSQGVPGLTTSATVTGMTPEGALAVRLTIGNQSAVDLTGAEVGQLFDRDLAGASLVGAPSTGAGQVSVDAAGLHWTGALVGGSQALVDYTVTVPESTTAPETFNAEWSGKPLAVSVTSTSEQCASASASPLPPPPPVVEEPSASQQSTGTPEPSEEAVSSEDGQSPTASATQEPTGQPEYQKPTSAGATSTYPSGLTVRYSHVAASGASGATIAAGTLDSSGTYGPSSVASSAATSIDYPTPSTSGSWRASGTTTITFSRPVRNPRLHIGGIGGTDPSSARFDLADGGGATMSQGAGWKGFTVTATSIRDNNSKYSVGCTDSEPAGCGTVLFTGVTSQIVLDVSVTGGGGSSSDTVRFLASVDEDCSNAPSSFGDASHAVSDLALGDTTTVDKSGVASTNACQVVGSAVDANPAFPGLSTTDAGGSYEVTVPVSDGAGAATTAESTLAGWIDFNGNGRFDTGERATVTVPAGSSTAKLVWTVPADTKIGKVWTRLRIGYASAQVTSVSGMADSGEVEDYQIDVEPRADVEVTKTATTDSVPGGTIRYTVKVKNIGPDPAAAVKVTDKLHASLTFVSVSSGCTHSAGTVTCDPGTMGRNAEQTYTITAKVSATATDGQKIANTATATTTSKETVTTNNSATATTTISTKADLVSSKVAPTAMAAGRVVTYTLSVKNNGPADAANVVFSDQLDPALSFVSADPAICTMSGRTLTCRQATLANGDIVSVKVNVKIDPDTKPGTKITNGMTSSSDNPDPNPDNNTVPPTPAPDVTAEADLVLTKRSEGVPVAGQTGDYTLVVRNDGPATARNVRIVDDLDANVTFVSASPSGCSATGQSVTCTLASLAPGESKTFTLTVRVKAGMPPGTAIPNTAKVSSDTSDPNTGNNTANSRWPAVDTQADLVSSKTAPDRLIAGQTADYMLTVTNNGPSVAKNVTITDTLHDALTFVSSDPAKCTAAGKKVTCALGDLAAGETVTVKLTVKVASGTAKGTKISNGMTAGSDTPDPTPDNNVVPPKPGPDVETEADLSTKKKTSGGKVAPGETFQYTITTSNAGPSDALNVSVSDDIPAPLAFVSSTSSCKANGQSVTCGPQATLAPGASVSWTFTVKLSPSYTGDGSDLGNVASSKSDTPDPNPDNNKNDPTPAPDIDAAKADLSTKKEAIGGPVTPGETFQYKVTTSNAGPSDARNVMVVDDLPKGLTFVSSADGCISNGQTVTCGPRPVLAVGASVSWTFTVKLTASYTGKGADLGNVAASKSDTKDPNPDNNKSDPTPPPPITDPKADLSTKKEAIGGPVTPGGIFQYKVTTSNAGPSDAKNVSVVDDLLAPLSFVSSPDGCTAAGQKVTCGPRPTLVVGDSVSWIFVVKLSPAYTGDGSDLGNVATSKSDTVDPNPDNNSNDPVFPPDIDGAKADLSTKKEAIGGPVTPGGTFQYKITVSNAGPSDAKNVKVSDPLPAPLSFVSSSDGCTASGQTVSCGPRATLAIGASVSWTFTVKLASSYTGKGADLGNVATSDSDTPDPNPDNNKNDPAPPPDITDPKADLSTKKEAIGTSVTPGETFQYKITTSNAGLSDAKNVTVVDDLPAGLTFVSSTDACAASGQKVTCGPAATLVAGTSVSWTFTVKLASSYTGKGADLGNVAASKSDTIDPNPDNNKSDPTPPPPITDPKADLSTKKEAIGTSVTPGQTYDYKITVSNAGPSDAKNVGASDDLATPLSFVSSADGCKATGQKVTCGPKAILPVGESVSWTFTVKLASAYTGDGSDMMNVATADSDTVDPDPDNNKTDPVPPPTPDKGKADLSTKKEALAKTITPGQTFQYKITTSNAGPSDAQNVSVVDELPRGLSFVSSADACTAAGQTVTCGPRPSLAPGGSVSWTFTVKLASSYTGDGKDLTNVATSKSDTPDPNPDNNDSDPVPPPTPDGGKADLSTKKEALAKTITPGETFEYKITVSNAGPSDARNVSVSDPLPKGLTFVSSLDGCTAAGQTVSCGPEAVVVTGASVSWTFTVKLDPAYRGNGRDLGNVASSKSDTPDPNPDNNETDPVPPPTPDNGKADLSTKKETLQKTVTPGETFQYKITVSNAGPSDALNVSASDPLPTPLSFVSSADGCKATGQTVTCGPQASLAVGASVSWTFTVKLAAAYTGDGSDMGNVASSKSDTPDPNPDNNETDPVPPPTPDGGKADLSIKKEALAKTVSPGATFQYKITVSNAGPSDAQNVSVTDELPKGLTFVSSTDACTGIGQAVTCGPRPSLAPGGSVSWTFTVKLASSYTGDGKDLMNVATADSDTPDPNPDNNDSDPVPPPTPDGGKADLSTVKEVIGESVHPGETYQYKITTSNAGPSDARNVSVVDDLPKGLSFVSSADGCTAAGQTVTCGPQAILVAGKSVSWTFTVRLAASYAGDGSDLENVASSKSDTPDPNPDNNDSDPVNPPAPYGGKADLSTKKEAIGGPVTPGETYQYKITTTNAGPSDAKHVTVVDELPTGLTFVSSADGCKAAGQTVTCGPLASLAEDKSVSWTFTVKLAPSYRGNGSDLANTATSNSDTDDPDPDNNKSDPVPAPDIDKPKADLSTKKEALAKTVTPGGTFQYKVTTSNAGPSDAQNVKVVDGLPKGLTFVSGDGCTAAGQTVTCGPQATLAAGASVSWTFTVKLAASYLGDGKDLVNVATSDSDTVDPNPDNNESDPTPSPTPDGGKADLSTKKEAIGKSITPGETFQYKITTSNAGLSDAQKVKVVDELPKGLTFVSSTDACTAAGQTVTCGPQATLAAGASVSWTFTVKLAASYTGNGSDLGNKATSDSDTPDPNPDNNETDPVPPPPVNDPSADLAVVKAAVGDKRVSPGDTFEYTLKVTNHGPSDAANAKVTDELPEVLSFISGDGCTAEGRNITCGPKAVLAAGESVTWTITVKLAASYAGDGPDVLNTAKVTSDTADPKPDNNTSNATVPGGRTDRLHDLEVKLSKPAQMAEEGTVTAVVTNNGKAHALGATLTITLHESLTMAGPATGAECTGDRVVTCRISDTISSPESLKRQVAEAGNTEAGSPEATVPQVEITIPVKATSGCRKSVTRADSHAEVAPVGGAIDHVPGNNKATASTNILAGGDDCPKPMPITGGKVLTITGAGLALILAGAILIVAVKRRNRRRGDHTITSA